MLNFSQLLNAFLPILLASAFCLILHVVHFFHIHDGFLLAIYLLVFHFAVSLGTVLMIAGSLKQRRNHFETKSKQNISEAETLPRTHKSPLSSRRFHGRM